MTRYTQVIGPVGKITEFIINVYRVYTQEYIHRLTATQHTEAD